MALHVSVAEAAQMQRRTRGSVVLERFLAQQQGGRDGVAARTWAAMPLHMRATLLMVCTTRRVHVDGVPLEVTASVPWMQLDEPERLRIASTAREWRRSLESSALL